jgi:DNA mismatch repair ATPase MutL
LKNYGFEMIEVADNGDGMSEVDMERVGLPHHTSKLRRFEDLENLNSLGFRGEALASLVALSEVSIGSKPKSSLIIDQKDLPAVMVDLDQHGKVRSRHSIAREVTK